MSRETKIRGLKASLALLTGVSSLAMVQPAFAQQITEDEDGDVIVVRGIAQSLAASSDIKRRSQGVVDALSAEDIGDFPDTNLAESLQRVTGVSIDRRNGEGSTVTVRGFGPGFNLVLLNGRQMPTAFIGDGNDAASRSFDFGNLASEGIASVEIYKSGRADLPTGGIGSTLNIKTARPLDAPGLRFSAGVKGVLDKSNTTLGEENLTPEISAIFSNTFADNKFGVALIGSYQDRESGFAQFGTSSGWRGAYRGDEANWGTLPPADSGRVTNRPGPDDIYSVPQNGNYALTQIRRERTNGQLVLQARPTDRIESTLDFFYSENKISDQTSDMSVWFNHGNTTSAWGDGPISDIQFYNEVFDPAFPSDLSFGSKNVAIVSENHSVGLNVEYEVTDRLTLTVDAHSSSAESVPDSPFGSNGVVSTAGFYLASQGLDFTTDLPTLSLGFVDGVSDIDPSRMLGTGSTFQAATIRTEIDQLQLFGSYSFDNFIKSIDFGASLTKNDYRSTFSNNQRDSWGGVGSPDDYPDDIWQRANLASNFDQLSGYRDTFQEFFVVDFDRLIDILDTDFGGQSAVCGGDGVCTADLVQVDRRTEEETLAAFIEVNTDFEIGTMPTSINVGLRYEQTDVMSDALVPFPTGTAWVAANELSLLGVNDPANRDFTSLEGDYDYFLPAIDFQVQPTDELVLRASYSHTMTRPDYASIQGGQTVAQLFRVDGGDGNSGNPDLLPFLSRNIDLSAEYYYGEGSYFSAGYYYKEVENFIGRQVTEGVTPFDVVTPIGGQRYNDAVAALGGSMDSDAIRQYIFANADPSTFEIFFVNPADGFVTGNIFGVPGEDPTVPFRISQPVNSDETKSVDGWEFAWQHLLGDTGFGWILNYTIVDGDVTFDNNVVPSDGTVQEPLLGLSDSYNIQAFYDKNGFQARLAYNWRDQFLTSAVGVNGIPDNPLYVEEFGQLDFNASYDVNDSLTVFVEGINVLDETRSVVGRSSAYLNFVTQTGPRYQFGARYRF
ncbi:MAG: TonB-dependent receptor [Parvularculaceae bacterium]|nr:TonB-dependent receptor [Parvularculaceae bacterium]